MFDEARLSLLRCPDCPGSPLDLLSGSASGGELRCRTCHRRFAIREGVPRLMPRALSADGSPPAGSEGGWAAWNDRLGAFLRWRREQRQEKDEARRRAHLAESERIRDLFVRFCALGPGRVVEIGCGHGSLRTSPRWNPEAEYWGIDPVIVKSPACRFPLVQGVGEHLPFADGSFEALLVKESLNHFADLTAFLREARRVLRPGGRLLLVDAAEDTWGRGPAPRPARGRAGRAFRRLFAGDLGGLARSLSRHLRGERCLEAGETRVHHLGADSMAALIREHLGETEQSLAGDHVLLAARKKAGS